MNVEAILIKDGPDPDRDEGPPKGFGGGDDSCGHPECATERALTCGIETIYETMLVMELAGWELTNQTVEELRSLRDSLNKMFAVEDPSKIIGDIFFVDRHKK